MEAVSSQEGTWGARSKALGRAGEMKPSSRYLTPPPVAAQRGAAQRLREAGLNGTPVLGDTAISGHLQRLEDGQVSKATLMQYADWHLAVEHLRCILQSEAVHPDC